MKNDSTSTLKKIALFPVKVAWGAVKVALIITLAVMIALAFVCFSRAAQPMNLPVTNGMTYNAFLQERKDALAATGDVTFLTKTELITWPVVKSFLVSYPATYSALYPKSDLTTCKSLIKTTRQTGGLL